MLTFLKITDEGFFRDKSTSAYNLCNVPTAKQNRNKNISLSDSGRPVEPIKKTGFCSVKFGDALA